MPEICRFFGITLWEKAQKGEKIGRIEPLK